jgi:hypothetical protein
MYGRNQTEAYINRNRKGKWKWIGQTLRKPPSDITKGTLSGIHMEPGKEDSLELAKKSAK